MFVPMEIFLSIPTAEVQTSVNAQMAFMIFRSFILFFREETTHFLHRGTSETIIDESPEKSDL